MKLPAFSAFLSTAGVFDRRKNKERAAPADGVLPQADARPSELLIAAGSSIIRLVEMLIERAHLARASDVHLAPREDALVVRVRIDGILQDAHILPKAIHQEMISRIKILCGLRIDEHYAAQDGRFRLAIAGAPADVRVSIVPTYWGENAVLRILSDTAEEFSLSSLGFSGENIDRIVRAIKKPFGLILATGPTGSGKTTSMYTVVKMLNAPGVSIITLEDPIEYSIPRVTQIQINPKTGLTFGSGLRSLLRQDPDILMVGEIRDAETAGLAVNTALTGHLVLSTLHTNDAPSTIVRLLDMGVEPYLVVSTVAIAIGQRLVRRICADCRRARRMTSAEAAHFKSVMPPGFVRGRGTLYEGRGCAACAGTGFRGRAGIHEVMEMDDALREKILRKAPASELRAAAIERGMTPMLHDGFAKALGGETSLAEVLRMRYE